jgi:hypothetical protein
MARALEDRPAPAPLRVGVLLDGESLPAWAHRLLWQVTASPLAELQLIVLRDGQSRPARPRPPLVFRAYEKLDRRLFGGRQDHAEPVVDSPLLGGCKRLTVQPVACDGGESFPAAVVEAIRADRLDVLLQLGFGSLRGDILGAAKHGIWTFEHDERERNGIPPLFWELAQATPITETTLLARDPSGTRVLYRSFSSTQRNSLHRNRNGALWKASEFAVRCLADLAAGRVPQAQQQAQMGEQTRQPARAPRALDVARLLLTTTTRVARNRARLRREDARWFIALRRRSGASILDDDLAGFEPLVAPPGRFYADPCVIRVGDVDHLFFEDADVASGIGVIRWLAIGPDGTTSPSQVVLACEHHLSYPFVFRFGDDFYMIPETSENRTVELYRARSFPLRWELEKVLFRDVIATDATVHTHGGRLWLFMAMSAAGGAVNDELFLFHADSPHGEWIAHPRNPIVSDVRRARPAGPLFSEGSTLYRPGQDCADEYGSAFWVSRVDRLDELEYHETPVRRVDAGWHPGAHCTHTICRGGELEALDGRTWTSLGR